MPLPQSTAIVIGRASRQSATMRAEYSAPIAIVALRPRPEA